jgi:hypothetical protein
MENRNWKDVAEIVGITAIVVSLVFFGYQMQQDRRIALAAHELSLFEARFYVNQSISEHPEIWLRGNAGEALIESERLIFRNIVDNAVRRAFYHAQAADELKQPVLDLIVHNFAVWLYQHPHARRIVFEDREKRRDLLASVHEASGVSFFWRMLEEDLSILDEAHGTAAK